MTYRGIIIGLLGSFTLGCASATKTTREEVQTVTGRLVPIGQFGNLQSGIALSSDQIGNVYVVDQTLPGVIKYSLSGDSLSSMIGRGRDRQQFDNPLDIDAGLTNTIYVADNGNHRIEKYTRDFAHVATVERHEARENDLSFGYPSQVATDDAGNIYTIDAENRRVVKIRSNLALERIIGGYTSSGDPRGVLSNPVRLTVDGENNLIVLDREGHVFVAYDNLGTAIARHEIDGWTGDGSNPIFTALSARNDTLFALAKNEIRLYHSTTFQKLGRYTIEASEQMMDIDLRHMPVMLSRKKVYRMTLVKPQ